MKPTLEYLEGLLQEKEEEIKRIQLAVHLNMCPECGEDLITFEEKYKRKGFIFEHTYTKTFRKCSKDELHYIEVLEDSFYTEDYYGY